MLFRSLDMWSRGNDTLSNDNWVRSNFSGLNAGTVYGADGKYYALDQSGQMHQLGTDQYDYSRDPNYSGESGSKAIDVLANYSGVPKSELEKAYYNAEAQLWAGNPVDSWKPYSIASPRGWNFMSPLDHYKFIAEQYNKNNPENQIDVSKFYDAAKSDEQRQKIADYAKAEIGRAHV